MGERNPRTPQRGGASTPKIGSGPGRRIATPSVPVIDSGLVGWLAVRFSLFITGEVSRGEKMLESGTDPESYVTEYTLVYEEK